MQILYIDHYAGGPAYGMEYRPFYLAREWVRRGHQVLVVGASYAHVRNHQPPFSGNFAREVLDGVPFLWLRTPAYSGNGMGRVLNIATFLYQLRRWRRWLDFRPDVVIASSTYPADIGPARRIARAHGATLAWEVHDLWPLTPIEIGGMSPRHPFIAWMQDAEDAACHDADVVVSILPLAESHLREHGLIPGKFVHVPNGIDPSEWTDAGAAPLPETHGATLRAARVQGHLVVLYAGSHTIANDLDGLLDAARVAEDDPVTWVLVGSGPEKARLAQRIADEKLANVVMLDPVAKAAIPTLLAGADILYMGLRPSPLYRFGISLNKLMDYLMAARPVLCVMDAGNDPVGEAGCGITVPPGTPAAVVHALRALAALSPVERSAMGARGRAHILKGQTYPVLADRFLEAVSRPVTEVSEGLGRG